MATDSIDALLRADEDELKAKRARLRAFARAVETAREGITAARQNAEEIATRDGFSRADLGRTFDLSASEKAVLLPTRRSKSGSEGSVVQRADASRDA